MQGILRHALGNFIFSPEYQKNLKEGAKKMNKMKILKKAKTGGQLHGKDLKKVYMRKMKKK